MEPTIITRFAIASEDGVEILKHLARTIATEKFQTLVSPQVLDKYMEEVLSDKKLIDDLNEILTTQWLVVYKNGQPAGYARMTSKGRMPGLDGKSLIRIADFGVLQEYNNIDVLQSLFDKCYSIGKSYQAIWLNEYAASPLLNFFEQHKFVRIEEGTSFYELPLPSVFLIREKEAMM